MCTFDEQWLNTIESKGHVHIMCRCVNYNTINNICVYRADNYSAQNGSESRFRDRCFSVELCYILWSVLLHHWNCVAPFLGA